MALSRNRGALALILAISFPLIMWGSGVQAQTGFTTFNSQEYGFSIQYPNDWVKLDKPRGNYYVVFQAPDLMDNFRNRIHVACHRPVKDPLKVFLDEFRNGIKTLQEQSKGRGSDSEEVRILDEGEFMGSTPGAYYFFIQALDDKLKIWMDIVIVFYKHEDTLLRISCLAPSEGMEQMQPIYNKVLVSVKFSGQRQQQPTETTGPSAAPAPAPGEAPSPAGPAPGQPSETTNYQSTPSTGPSGPAPETRGPSTGPSVTPQGPTQPGPNQAGPNQPGPNQPGPSMAPAPGNQPGPGAGASPAPAGPTSGPGIVDRN